MSNPEVRINFSWLFYQDISAKLNLNHGWELPAGEQCEVWTEAYRQAWSKTGEAVLAGMQEITGLTFYKNVIDVTTAPDIISKSNPLLLSFQDEPEVVTDTLAHEITHVLLCDNTILSIYGDNRDYQLGSKWRALFGFEDDFDALVHVPVFAIMKKLFVDYLDDPDYEARDRKLMQKYKAASHLKAWDYVSEAGAEVIIEKLKTSYEEIAKELEAAK